MSAELRNRFVLSMAAWMVVGLVGLFALNRLSVDTYFTISFIGLVAMMQLYAPATERPKWWRGLVWVEILCFLTFGYILYVRIATF
ncbi:hypothetical protein [Natronomonas sp.]|uniref:hypothetical protein n=1 Tax=Natronomonas sp. TaxID=2184060 RepID=UPI0039760704